MSARWLIVVVLLTALPLACGDRNAPGSAASPTRDSAGVAIVENRAPVWTDADAWRLSDTPTLTLGSAESDSAQQLYQVTGAVRLSDGTIVVADNGSSELRYFSPDGTLRAKAGRKGGGPGEFQGLVSVNRLPGDSLLALDLMNRRLSLFDADGRHARDIPISSSAPFMLQIAGRLADGRYLAFSPMQDGPALLSRPAGPGRDSVVVLLLDTTATVADTLGLYPGSRVNVRSMELMGHSFPAPVPVAFSPSTSVAAADTVLYVGTSDTYEIRVLSPDGKLDRLIRFAREPRPVTDADKKAYADRVKKLRLPDAVQATAGPMLEQMRKAMSDVEYPETMPAYRQLLVDAEQNLWVEDYTGPGTSEPRRWSVFDSRGTLLGSVTMPARLNVNEIGSDYVLGIMKDESEIEQVVLYQLMKPASARETS